jgi:uncharacterized membrane protein YgaE (UPF0421/DUF939 family)
MPDERVSGGSTPPRKRADRRGVGSGGIRRSAGARSGTLSVSRLGTSLPAILQITVAALVAYLIARELLGHAVPLLAVTVSLSSLGFVRDARPVRVLETAFGMTLGIAVAEAVVLAFGQGVVQLAVVLAMTLAIARLLSPSAGFAIAAAIQSVLVSLLAAPDGGPFVRVVDGVVGGAVALLATALIPRDPRRAALREAHAVFAEFLAVTSSLVAALRFADRGEAEGALARARGTQPFIDSWRAALDSARAIVRVSPFVRRHAAELNRQAVALDGMDLAVRNLRVVTRRIDFVGRDGRPRLAVADLVARIATAVTLLDASFDDIEQLPLARQTLEQLASHLAPGDVLEEAEPASEQTLVMALRPLVVDLLVAAGTPVGEAQALLPPA